MNEPSHSEQHNRNAGAYLRQSENSYLIDHSSGLYYPNSNQGRREVDEEVRGYARDKPFFASVQTEWTDTVAAIAACLGLIISIATLCLLGLTVYWTTQQWRTMNSTLGEIRKQTEYARSAAHEAQTANSDSRDRFRQDERPYIWLTNDLGRPQFFPIPNTSKGAIFWNWHITNYGKTPAYHIRYSQEIKLGTEPFALSAGPKEGHGVPMPPTKDDFDSVVSNSNVTQTEFNRLSASFHGVSIRVHIFYDDSYGIKYETAFCFATLQTTSINYCKDGNYIK